MAVELWTCRRLAEAVLLRSGLFVVRVTLSLLLCAAQASTAHADPASCLEKVSSYVAEVDRLLAREKNLITPFEDLNKQYSEFRDCDTDALLEVVWRSPFLMQIAYNPRVKAYYVLFSSNDVKIEFAYYARERKSNTPSAGWVNK